MGTFCRKKLLSVISTCVFAANINMAAFAVNLTVPGTNPTINSAVTQSNATTGGTNTLSIGANQTITAAIATITQNLAISGNNPASLWTVNLNHISAQRFSFSTGVYSISDLIVTNSLGGAVNKGSGSLTINNAVFSNNIIDNTGLNGGAIVGSTGSLIINNSAFTNNSTASGSGSGGAIYVSGGTVNIDNSTFTNNFAFSGAGAVLTGPTAITTITNSTFTDNTASGTSNAGGAVFNNGGTVTIGNSTFIHNRGTAGGGSGGAIINYNGGTMHISGSAFTNNSTGSFGGAIYNYNNGRMDITGGSFSTNAATYGGALYNAAGGILDIGGNITFTGNTATTQGGAIYNIATMNINNAIFNSNKATGTGNTIYGGAIYSDGVLNIGANSASVVQFNNNTATYGGGAISNRLAGNTLNVDNASFVLNKTSTGGGGAISNGGAMNIGQNSTSVVEFKNNVGDSAGAISNYGVLSYIDNAVFDTNSSITAYAGAIANGGTSTVLNIGQRLTDTVTFKNNTAKTYGGAIYNYMTINIDNAVFSSNNAGNYGGAIYNGNGSSGTINIGLNSANAVAFNNNIATTYGGAIYNNTNGTITIGNAVFNSNIAKGLYGGAIYNGGTLNLNSTLGDIIFSNNTANNLANDIYNTSGGIINITGTANNVTIGDGISGSGTINKSGSGNLLLNGNNSGFTGTFNQTAGQTIVSQTGRMFGGTKNISNSALQITGLPINYSVNLGNNAIFTNLAATMEGGILSSSNIHFTGLGATTTFTKDPALVQDVNAIYTLTNKIDNGQINTLVFDNADVFIGAADYTGNTIYSFQNSTMDITSTGIRDINFTNLNTNNAKIAFNLSFDAETSGVVLNSDTLSAANVTGDGTLAIHTIKVVNDDDDGLTGTREAKILFGSGLNFDTTSTFDNVATIAYEYTTTIDPLDNTKILLTVVNAATENSLAKMNTLDGNRGFNFSFFEGENVVYNIGGSLGETAEGTFVVQGFDSDPTHGVISGNILSETRSIIGQGSLFRLLQNTDLFIANLTLQDAFIIGDGSAVFLNNSAAVAEIYNSILQNNTSTGLGGAVFNAAKTLAIEKGIFKSNQGQNGGAIYNEGIMEMIFDAFSSNHATDNGGAIYTYLGTVTVDNTSFNSNTADASGGAIYNAGSALTLGETSFDSNRADVDGGAVYNTDTMTVQRSSSFTNNTAGNNGGAIYNSGTLNLDSTYGNIIFSGNTANSIPNDIYNDNATVNIDGIGGTVYLEDGIAGTGTINKSGNSGLVLGGNNSNYTGDFIQTGGTTDVTGTFFTDSDTISILNSTLNLGSQAYFNNTNVLNVNNSSINSINGAIQTNTINTMNVGPGTVNFAIDVNAFDAISDQYIIQNLNGTGIINISDISIIGEAPTALQIPFLAFNSSNISSGIIFETTTQEVQTPIYKYNLVSDGNGQFRLIRFGTELNPQVFRGQVATMAAYYNQLVVDNLLFDHVHLESGVITASIFDNKYANIYPQFSPYQYSRQNAGLWYKAYTTMENLLMTQNFDIENHNYGSLIGADFEAVKLENGWKLLPTAYIAYNGGHQTFDNVSMYQNGGQAGAMATFLKENFIGSILAYGGGYSNEMQVDSATDRTGNWFAGTAAKLAYNIRATRDLTFQPTALVAYNIFGEQHWGSDFGAVSMNSGLLNGINVAPGLNFIYNQESWSLYGITQYVFNINDNINGSAGNVHLSDISMRHGFIEYGLGMTKTWGEQFLGYCQTTIRNGGRNGIGLQAGITYRF